MSRRSVRLALLAAIAFAGGSAWVPAALVCLTAALATSARLR